MISRARAGARMRDNERPTGAPSRNGDSRSRRTRIWQKLLQPVRVLTNALPSDKVARLAQVEDLTIGAEPEHLDDL